MGRKWLPPTSRVHRPQWFVSAGVDPTSKAIPTKGGGVGALSLPQRGSGRDGGPAPSVLRAGVREADRGLGRILGPRFSDSGLRVIQVPRIPSHKPLSTSLPIPQPAQSPLGSALYLCEGRFLPCSHHASQLPWEAGVQPHRLLCTLACTWPAHPCCPREGVCPLHFLPALSWQSQEGHLHYAHLASGTSLTALARLSWVCWLESHARLWVPHLGRVTLWGPWRPPHPHLPRSHRLTSTQALTSALPSPSQCPWPQGSVYCPV